WSWGRDARKPGLGQTATTIIEATHDELGHYQLHCEDSQEILFTENDSNFERLWNVPNHSPFVKDSINDAVIHNNIDLVNPNKIGTNAATHYRFTIAPGDSVSIRLRLTRTDLGSTRNAT